MDMYISPDILKNIHAWVQLALETHLKAGFTNDPQVSLTSLKLKAHTCP